MSRKTYFRMPDFDHPPNGSVLLGQIITSPRDPSRRLAPPLLPVPEVHMGKKTDYVEEIERAQKGEIGLWVQFLASILGAGGDVAAKWAKEHKDILQFRELEASFFEPDDEYLKRSVASSEHVWEHIKRTPGNSLYMITGVKIARGARRIVRTRSAGGVDVKIGVDATPFTGVPVQGGPEFRIESGRGEMSQFGGSSDFVFAYRLLRIIPKPHGTFKVKQFVKRAETLSSDGHYIEDVDRDGSHEPAPSAMDVEIKDVELDKSDYGAMPKTLPFDVDAMEFHDEFDGTPGMLIVPGPEDE